MSRINALAITAGMATAGGGTTFCVSSLCEATAVAGVNQSLITIQAAEGETEHLPNPDLVHTIRVCAVHLPRLRLGYSTSFRTVVRDYCRAHGVQIIHSHGIWTQPNYVAASVARELSLPLVVSPHGMLEPWAWRHRAWKKRPVWWLWERRNLHSAAMLSATAQSEVDALRTLGLHNPIALVPNGVYLSPISQRAEIKGPKTGVRTALFISRIHPKKGLLNLVAAWSQVRPAGWRMVICGPDESGHTQQVKQAVKKAGLSNVFCLKAPVYSAEKEALYASADLFVLPTFSENFGLVIAEALAAGVPAITTKGAPWEELRTRQCGWWVDIGIEPLAGALREAMSLSDQERHEMGLRGRQLVDEKYCWPKIARDMKSVYDWVLGGGPLPVSVQSV